VWVEGAGSFYSPLASDGLNADLAERLALRILLVAANRLGCINHVLLTVDATRSRGLMLLAVALSQITLSMTPQVIANRPIKHRYRREFSKGGKLQVVKAIMITTPMFDLPLERVHNLVAERDSFEFAGSQ
jgi:dethiobiotin synthetase